MAIMNKSYKEILWKRTQIKRDTWERKYHLLFRNVLNNDFKMLADRIDVTNYSSNTVLGWMSKSPMEKMFIQMYRAVGAAFARDSYQQLKAESQNMMFKSEEELVDTWYNEMMNWVRTRATERIVSITASSRELAKRIIRGVIETSANEGWGADVTARAIKKGLIQKGVEMNQWRALRIARTEIVTASNEGSFMGAQSLGYPLDKFWIATYDSRTRDTHLVIEQQNPKAMDEAFDVGTYKMQKPGDPAGGAEEVINCRCSIAFKIKGI